MMKCDRVGQCDAGTLVRAKAAEILNAVETQGDFAEVRLDAFLSQDLLSDARDRRLLTNIVYGVLRERGRLDWQISHIYRGDYAALEAGIKQILRCAIYQLTFLERLPAFAVCDAAANSARILMPHAVGLVNGICRGFLRRGSTIEAPADDIVLSAPAQLSHPSWLVRRLLRHHAAAAVVEFCHRNNSIPKVCIRTNTLKISRAELRDRLIAEGTVTMPTSLSPQGLLVEKSLLPPQKTRCFAAGLYVIQDENSQLLAPLADVAGVSTVLDLCAGRGIKTTQLAALMENRGKIIATDIAAGKLAELRLLAARLGATNIEIVPLAAALAMRTTFERILVDVPCSGTGTLGRNPEIKWRLQEDDIRQLCRTQRRLLQQAGMLAKIGGIIIYATCSVLPAENEEVVVSFLRDNTNFRLYPQEHEEESAPAATRSPSGVNDEGAVLGGCEGNLAYARNPGRDRCGEIRDFFVRRLLRVS